jgi:hypothetical protein
VLHEIAPPVGAENGSLAGLQAACGEGEPDDHTRQGDGGNGSKDGEVRGDIAKHGRRRLQREDDLELERVVLDVLL